MENINVLVSGCCGKMGKEIVKAVTASEGMKVVAAVDLGHFGEDVGEISGCGSLGVNIESDLATAIRKYEPDVMIDFTVAEACEKNLAIAVDHGVRFVTGTTNMRQDVLNKIFAQANAKKLGGLWAANYAIGAVLMMNFAKVAAKYMPSCEIIELHHDKKLDSPSGTAKVTANIIAQARVNNPKVVDADSQARGLIVEDIPIHSIRLQGYVASQEVLFGGEGQILSIRHDTIGRESFMPGIVMACRKVMEVDHIIIGMDSLLS